MSVAAPGIDAPCSPDMRDTFNQPELLASDQIAASMRRPLGQSRRAHHYAIKIFMEDRSLAFEFETDRGRLRLVRARGHWTISFADQRGGAYRSPECAVLAAAEHRSGVAAWDEFKSFEVSSDLLDWRPLGESV